MNIYLTFPDCHRRGGVERIMVECANFLATRGHTVSVLAASFDAGVLDPAVAPVTIPAAGGNLERLRAFHAGATAKLAQLRARAPGPHAAFGVTSPPDGILWVQSVHAEWIRIARASRNFVGRLKQQLNPFHPFILKREADYYRNRKYRRLIALTPRVKQELIDHYAVPEADIDLLPNGYNAAEFNPQRRVTDREPVRRELGYGPGDKVLLFVANELERKGFFPLVQALAALHDPGLKLLVVGKAPVAPHRALLERLNIAGQVHYAGPSADAGRFYAAADLFVLPTYYEAWGMVIVEALAAGLPVITSKLAGAAIAVGPDTGILLDDPRDPKEIAAALARLLSTAPPAPAAVARSVQEYRWSVLLQRYEHILMESVDAPVSIHP